MPLPFGASEQDYKLCVAIVRELTGRQDVEESALQLLHIIEAKGGDYQIETIRAFAKAYLK